MGKKDILFVSLLVFFWIVFFRKFFFQRMVPVPGNLLVSFFSPWKEEKWPQYPGGVYKQGLFGYDALKMMYPWRHFSTQEMAKGKWPLWNPYQFAGAPHLGNFQTAVFYPPNLLYLVLPQVWAWTVLFLLQPLIAGFFMYLLMRKLRVSPLGAFFASFSYAFSLTFSVWLIWNMIAHQFMYLPLILYFVEKYREKNKTSYLLSLSLFLSLAFLAGHPQVFLLLFIFSSIYFFYRIGRIKEWLLVGFFTFALTAVAWLPMVEYYQAASRGIPSSEFSFERSLLPWQNLIALLAPDFFGNPTTANHWGKTDYTETSLYVGIVALTFAIIACFTKKKSKFKFFVLAMLAVFAFCLDWFVPRIFLWLKIPIISSSVAVRVLFLATFCLSLMAGFGLDIFTKKRKLPSVIFFIGLIFVFLWLAVLTISKVLPSQPWFENLKVMRRNLVLPTLVFATTVLVLFLGTKLKNLKRKLLFFLIPVMALDLFYVANKAIPFTYKQLVFPSHPLIEFLQKKSQLYRFAGSQASNIEANFATFYNIFSTEGYDALYPRHYGELVWAVKSGGYNPDISRTTVIFPTDRSDAQRRLEDLLGVKFILEKDDGYQSDWDPNYEIFFKERYKLVWQRKNWKVYENKKVFPRAFLGEEFIVLSDKKKIIKTIYHKDFDPLKTIILEEKPPLPMELDREEGKAKIVKYSPSEINIATESKGNKILFLSDTFYPGWKVFVDGEEERIYKADYAFRAVFVPKGKHEVVFSYRPLSFKIGLGISIISLGGILIILIHLRGGDLKEQNRLY